MILPAFLVFLVIVGAVFGWVGVPLLVLLVFSLVLFALVSRPQP